MEHIEVVKSVLEMDAEELKSLPTVNVRFTRRSIMDRRTNKVSGVTYTAEILIHNLVTTRMSISQAQFGLAMVSANQTAANQFTVPSYANYSKGVRKDDTKYFFAEIYISKDVVLRTFFSKDEVKLINALVLKGELKISFKNRPENDEPKVEILAEDTIVI